MPVRMSDGDALLVCCSGLETQHTEEGVVGNGNGLSRGDRRRNERIRRLREAAPTGNAILGIDLADEKQALVVTDHDSRVLARRRVTAKAWALGPALEWAVREAHRRGFASVTVACEPTGHRWQVIDRLAAERGLAMVCVQPLLVGRSRESEDYTRDKRDDKDAVLIARLAARLDCYLPERAGEDWARLRHLGARRDRLIVEATGCVAQLRDLLECAWPAALTAAKQPFDSVTWCAGLAVVLHRCDGRPERLARLGVDRFAAAVRREARARWGAAKIWSRIAGALFAALTDRAGALTQRPGALERAGWVLEDWRAVRARLAEVEGRMLAVLDELGLTELVTSIDGLSALGAAAMLAETGDPARFDSSRALVKHAGLAPRDNSSGEKQGRSRISGRGRPRLRLTAWRAVWGALRHNPVLATRYRHLTGRAHNPLTDGQARAALAAALPRWLHAITTTGKPWNPVTAAGTTTEPPMAA
jgi:transposase